MRRFEVNYKSSKSRRRNALEFHVPVRNGGSYKNVFMLLAIRNKWTEILLTEEDWNEVGDILEVLEPFQELTLQCSASSQLTIYQALQRYECADSHLEEWLVKFSGTVFHDGLDRAVDKLQLYYDRASAVENIAAALDPRYKLEFMKDLGESSRSGSTT
jgi:hypothetical protein